MITIELADEEARYIHKLVDADWGKLDKQMPSGNESVWITYSASSGALAVMEEAIANLDGEIVSSMDGCVIKKDGVQHGR